MCFAETQYILLDMRYKESLARYIMKMRNVSLVLWVLTSPVSLKDLFVLPLDSAVFV